MRDLETSVEMSGNVEYMIYQVGFQIDFCLS